MDKKSPEHTVTLTEGADDILRDWLDRLVATAEQEHTATDYEHLAALRKVTIDQMWSLIQRLGYSLLLANEHDGNIRISPDGNSLFWIYPKSGYHGGMILHEANDGDPTKARWSIHT